MTRLASPHDVTQLLKSVNNGIQQTFFLKGQATRRLNAAQANYDKVSARFEYLNQLKAALTSVKPQLPFEVDTTDLDFTPQNLNIREDILDELRKNPQGLKVLDFSFAPESSVRWELANLLADGTIQRKKSWKDSKKGGAKPYIYFLAKTEPNGKDPEITIEITKSPTPTKSNESSDFDFSLLDPIRDFLRNNPGSTYHEISSKFGDIDNKLKLFEKHKLISSSKPDGIVRRYWAVVTTTVDSEKE